MAQPTSPVLLLATTNRGKTREIRTILETLAIRILSFDDVGPWPEPDETGRTFAENAAIKAQAYAAASGLPTVAEDSGLEIDALGGRPGVQSARYPGATYPDKFANLYRELAASPRPWIARFVCAVAFVDRSGPATAASAPTFTCEARVEGEITPEPRGTSGFGYDPIFYYAPYGCTFGQLTTERKLLVAHRGQAFRQFRDWLLTRPPAERGVRD